MEISTARALSLMSTGLSLGVLHVLAGPDHLSALAVLSVGNSWRALTLGFRWGLGHSTGLILVAIIFIGLKGDLDLRRIGRFCDSLVGLFMIVIGIYGILGAVKIYREKAKKRDRDLHREDKLQPDKSNFDSSWVESGEGGQPTTSVVAGSMPGPLSSGLSLAAPSKRESSTDTTKSPRVVVQKFESSSHRDHIDRSLHHPDPAGFSEDPPDDHHHSELDEACGKDCWCPLVDMRDPLTQRIASFSIGILHGVAGPGGILGVLPAVEMTSWQASTVYLGSFVVASTLSMGAFAALYGEATKRIGAAQFFFDFVVRVFSSSMSIIVGVIWFVLAVLGKMEEFFH